jgi:hypothetical protein
MTDEEQLKGVVERMLDAAENESPPKAQNVKVAPCTSGTPPWFVGHWRDWHRGHGCGQDDGKPRSDAAATEIAQHAANEVTGYLTDAELSFLRARTTSGDTLLVRALDELRDRRTAEKKRAAASFDHSARTTKHFERLLGYCICAHCERLPAFETKKETAQ